ncbi:MAG: filamentous hemagglutinin N-terminal domain-containing protein, partial [Alphaproteobacteria bacterium]|nr:filamentous hemagglutinin N-terminal domain-containing protein [Alphaproteobacteria bacterium]
MSPITRRFHAFLAVVSLLLSQFLFIGSAYADLPITPDGTTNTQVTQTASGIDQINIAAPDSSGMSHNKFTDYNVNISGQVLNNFSSGNVGDVTNTNLAGLVTANPNLTSSGSARLILNEVTSSNISQLLGYVEIAGSKADLILANPNGFVCAGCGFVNTSRLGLIAGKSEFDQNHNLSFNLPLTTNHLPLITIEGLGLDAETTTATDIISSSVKLIGKIYGNLDGDLTIKTGEGKYGVSNKNIDPSPIQTLSSSTIPQGEGYPLFAIDASSLSNIQAGRVFLIATKEGVGVNMAAPILASDTIQIDANGDVHYSSIKAENSVDIKTAKKLESLSPNSEIIAPTINIQANDLTNHGKIISTNDLTLTTNDLANLGEISSLNSVSITSSSLTNQGWLLANNFLTINSQSLTNNENAFIKSFLNSVDLTITNDLTNHGKIISTTDLTITGNNNLINSGLISSNQKSKIQNQKLTNTGLIQATNDLTLTTNDLNNSNTKPTDGTVNAGIISLDGTIFLKANLVNNDSGMIMGRAIVLNPLSSDPQQLSLLSANRTLLSNQVNLSNNLGTFLATALIDLDLGNADYIINGDVTAKHLSITASNITNQGNVTTTDYIKLNANGSSATGQGNITNNGTLTAGTYLDLIANRFINNYGTIQASTDLTLTSNDSVINNYGTIRGGSGTTTINSGSSFNNAFASSVLTSNNNLNLNLGDDLNNYGEISVANDLTTNITNNLNNNSTALIWAGNDATFNIANTFTNTSADIYANRNLTIQKNIAGDKTTSVQNISGNIETYNGNIVINATSLENKRLVDPLSKVLGIPNARSNTNMSGWVYQYSWCGGNNCENWHHIYYGSNYLNSNSISGKIFSGKDLTLNLGSFKNDTSEIYSVGNTNIGYQTSFINNSV